MIINIALVLSIFLLFLPAAYAGKKQCQPYLKKLHNIQSLQRQAHSLKTSNSLNKREGKARNKWWQCEQGKLPIKYKKKKKKKKIKSKKSNVQFNLNSSVNQIAPFSTEKALIFKTRFQGDKQFSWLEYYQQPKACIRPKSTKKFAYCMEDKRKQQELFEKEYTLRN